MTVWSRTRAFAVSRATETISCDLLALIAAEPGVLTNCFPEGISLTQSGQRRDAVDRAPRHGRDLSRDADARPPEPMASGGEAGGGDVPIIVEIEEAALLALSL